jgi:polyhydroxyalkanoate synthesis regulator phasin
MDRRKLVMTGVVAGSVGVGSLIGAIAFAPGIGVAASDAETGDRTLAICVGAAGSLDAAAEAIDIGTSDLLSALRNGRTIAEVAEAHGVQVSEVIDAIVTAEHDRLDELVADGRLTHEQADELSADLEERATDLVNGDLAPFPLLEPGFGPGVIGAPGPFGRPAFIAGPGPWGFVDGPLAAAADAIGIDERALVAAIADGETIADVARAHDVEVSEVVDSIVASMQVSLDEAVENGWLSRDQAEELAEGLTERATDLVNGQAFPFPHPGWRWPPGRAVNGTTTSELSLY